MERLPLQRSETYTLNPILENEGTISGPMKIIDNIFREQLGLDVKEFDKDVL